MYCDSEDAFVIGFGALADIVDEKYRAYHVAGQQQMGAVDGSDNPSYVQEGDDPTFIINEMLYCDDPQIGEDLVSELALGAWRAVADGADPMYELDWNYVFRPCYPVRQLRQWTEFTERVRYDTRHFDDYARETLRELLGDSEGLQDDWLPPPILALGPQADKAIVFRARAVRSKDEMTRVLEDPATELGPPPRSLTRAGRMNSAGISFFYGALDEKTCIAEIRQSVGGRVVTGAFEVLTDLKLLDLTALADRRVRPAVGFFSARFDELHLRQEFFAAFGEVVSRPVQPHEEDIEYVPTQIVAEYVRNVLRLDGIAYRSALVSSDQPNVVLFKESAGVDGVLRLGAARPPSLALVSNAINAWRIDRIDISYSCLPDSSTEVPF